jgi:hypothetical protein
LAVAGVLAATAHGALRAVGAGFETPKAPFLWDAVPELVGSFTGIGVKDAFLAGFLVADGHEGHDEKSI